LEVRETLRKGIMDSTIIVDVLIALLLRDFIVHMFIGYMDPGEDSDEEN
jgi:predicted DNA-binding protein (UPF0278 family)